jgi:hypothetical protein
LVKHVDVAFFERRFWAMSYLRIVEVDPFVTLSYVTDIVTSVYTRAQMSYEAGKPELTVLRL